MSFTKKYENINDIIASYNQISLLNYIKRHNLSETEIVNIFNSNINEIDEYILRYDNCHPIQLIFALYYHYENPSYDLMKIHYLYCIENYNSTAMNNLGYYYQFTELDYEKCVLYYKMAISYHNSSAMNNLAYYYEKKENNIEKAVHYYEMAIKAGNEDALLNLSCLYYNQNDIENTKKYIDIAVKKGSITQNTYFKIMNNL